MKRPGLTADPTDEEVLDVWYRRLFGPGYKYVD